MVMSSRPSAENPTASDYMVPVVPSGRVDAEGHLEPMTRPRIVNPEGSILGTEGARNTGSGTANTVPSRSWPMQGQTQPAGHGVGAGTSTVPPWDGKGPQ